MLYLLMHRKGSKGSEIASKSIKYKLIAIGVIVAIVSIVSVAAYNYYMHQQVKNARTASFGPISELEHKHAVFKLFINGEEPVNFALPKYQLRSPYIHFENNVGTIIHRHAANVDIGYLFESMNMSFTKDCFILDDKRSFCNDENNTLKFYVNGVPNESYDKYVIQDGDRILISYGPRDDPDLNRQLQLVDALAGINKP